MTGAELKSRIFRLAPRPLVRLFASPYIAGETRADAVRLVGEIHARRGLYSTIDVLGEAIHDAAEAGAMLDEYLAILDEAAPMDFANISVKLSALGQSIDEDLCVRHVEKLLDRAARHGRFVRFDMEDHTTVDSTLRIYRHFAPRFPLIGPVLQSRLHRTERDIRDLAPLRPNVRLCIGIYNEPSEIALVSKPAMKERLLGMLETMWANGQYVAIATHDESVIRRALALADRMAVPPSGYEVQMLLGVPRARIQEEVKARGVKVRLYVPYGRHWYHYCLRRLEHNPEMARMVLGNLLRIGRG